MKNAERFTQEFGRILDCLNYGAVMYYCPENYELYKRIADLVIGQETQGMINGYKEMEYIADEEAWRIFKIIVARYMRVMRKLGEKAYGFENLTYEEEEEYIEHLKDSRYTQFYYFELSGSQ